MLPYTAANKSLFAHTDQLSEQSIVRNACGKQGMQCLFRKSLRRSLCRCMVNIQMDLTGTERGVGCSCENGHGTSGSMKGERFLDKQSYC